MINISQKYDELLQAFSSNKKYSGVDLSTTLISEEIFFHLFKMKLAGWNYRIEFKRGKKHPIPDIFQDILATYLRACLPDNFSIEVEKYIAQKQPQVDILINKDKVPYFVIEVKTNIGWSRHDLENAFEERADSVTKLFNINPKNIIYVFLEPSNVSSKFSAMYWDKKNKLPIKVKDRNYEKPFSYIYPLFNNIDPYYSLKKEDKIDRKIESKKYSDQEIFEIAKKNIVTPFEHILKLIQD